MFEIDLPIENGGVVFVDEEQATITPNTIICVKPGQERHTKFPLKCYYIHMVLEEGVLYDSLMKTPTFIPITDFSEYLYIFKSICNHRNEDIELNSIILHSLILKLIYTLSADCKKQVYARGFKRIDYERIDKSIKYIKEHLSEDLSLATVARIVSYSPVHFHVCFKAAIGKTLRAYIEDERIKKAIHLLSTTSLTLTEIASQCGFSSQSYFSCVFKKKMNKTPRDYIREDQKHYLI